MRQKLVENVIPCLDLVTEFVEGSSGETELRGFCLECPSHRFLSFLLIGENFISARGTSN